MNLRRIKDPNVVIASRIRCEKTASWYWWRFLRRQKALIIKKKKINFHFLKSKIFAHPWTLWPSTARHAGFTAVDGPTVPPLRTTEKWETTALGHWPVILRPDGSKVSLGTRRLSAWAHLWLAGPLGGSLLWPRPWQLGGWAPGRLEVQVQEWRLGPRQPRSQQAAV